MLTVVAILNHRGEAATPAIMAWHSWHTVTTARVVTAPPTSTPSSSRYFASRHHSDARCRDALRKRKPGTPKRRRADAPSRYDSAFSDTPNTASLRARGAEHHGARSRAHRGATFGVEFESHLSRRVPVQRADASGEDACIHAARSVGMREPQPRQRTAPAASRSPFSADARGRGPCTGGEPGRAPHVEGTAALARAPPGTFARRANAARSDAAKTQ